MNSILERINKNSKKIIFKQVLKQLGYFFAGLLILVIISSGLFAVYFNNNKTQIVAQINKIVNENIVGSITIKDVNYKFLKGFPNVTLALSQVELKDSLWNLHRRTLLKAAQIEIRVDVLDLLLNEITIDKIEIQQATLHLYKSKNGIVNSNIFRKKPNDKSSESSTTSSIRQINVSQFHFISENQIGKKLFDFDKIDLKSDVKFNDGNWNTIVHLKTFATSMAFNTERGSFVENKVLEGKVKVNFSKAKNQINVATENFAIGKEMFGINAIFSLDKNKSPFTIEIKTNILWRNASELLSDNISVRIDQFDLKNPIEVLCTIVGDMSATGDPEIKVKTKVRNNELTIPDGMITNCNFDASFTNNSKKGAGCNDANSTITLSKFTGDFKAIPFSIPLAMISNFENTTASGSFKSSFDITRLNTILSADLIRFSSGQAKVNLDFNFGIVDLKIDKPYFTGSITVKDAMANYGPRNLTFIKTNVELDFTEKALLIKKMNFKDNRNSVFMKGKIDNFLTLYYINPKKMVVDWNIYTPFLDVKNLVSILTDSNQTKAKKSNLKGNISDEIHDVIDKCQVVLNVKADRIVYNKLTATAAKVKVLLVDNELIIQKGKVNSCGGIITFDGTLVPDGKNYVVKSSTKIDKVDIAQFLTSMNNFGIKSFSPKNLKGSLTAQAVIQGKLFAGGALQTNSLAGKSQFAVLNGELIDFKPITNIAKFAFPFRNISNIVFKDLSGNFAINGELVKVNDLKVSSNILNLDINGIYSFGRGTKLALTIPLRDPEKDKFIDDKEARAEKRLEGIVLHLLAVDEDGKIKIRWNKDHQ
ncbi:MAG: AsmA family protein [Flavobacterium micromati]|nr:AsmA family protein [Flavobacterium micromati]